MAWNRVKSLGDKVAAVWKSPGGPTSLLVGLVIGSLADVGLIAFQLLVPNVANFIAAVVIALLPPISVLVGYDRARSDDPIRKLFDQPDARKAPFLLACAAALHRKPSVPDRDKKAAIEELASELRDLKSENQYIGAVIRDVAQHAVWAVCGRKTDQNAPNFYDANKISYDKNNNYVERVFLPPTTSVEATSIKKAIEDYHFPTGMLVRALTPGQNADDVRQTHNLPPGFGMTIMGQRKRLDGNPQSEPESKYAVLVHWGGLDSGGTHYGVVLRNSAWLGHFWDVFEQLRGVTEIVNPKAKSPGWQNFIQKYEAYKS